MRQFNDETPIYIQLRKHIEELILNRVLNDEDPIPSLRIMARDFKLNPITVGNAVNALAELGILYKKRGVGIYVSPGARDHLLKTRGKDFITEKLRPVLQTARQLELPKQTIIEIIETLYGGKDDK
ncbi:MAG TPA: GntR family transcriptional regulator [Candidatus Cloacimonadota bacterium]|nr:GntR family transcriptional regulator [Candidatus Cloacimonadota bacterium]